MAGLSRFASGAPLWSALVWTAIATAQGTVDTKIVIAWTAFDRVLGASQGRVTIVILNLSVMRLH